MQPISVDRPAEQPRVLITPEGEVISLEAVASLQRIADEQLAKRIKPEEPDSVAVNLSRSDRTPTRTAPITPSSAETTVRTPVRPAETSVRTTTSTAPSTPSSAETSVRTTTSTAPSTPSFAESIVRTPSATPLLTPLSVIEASRERALAKEQEHQSRGLGFMGRGISASPEAGSPLAPPRGRARQLSTGGALRVAEQQQRLREMGIEPPETFIERGTRKTSVFPEFLSNFFTEVSGLAGTRSDVGRRERRRAEPVPEPESNRIRSTQGGWNVQRRAEPEPESSRIRGTQGGWNVQRRTEPEQMGSINESATMQEHASTEAVD